MIPETAIIAHGPKRLPRRAKKHTIGTYRQLIVDLAAHKYTEDKGFPPPKRFFREARRYTRSLRIGFAPRESAR